MALSGPGYLAIMESASGSTSAWPTGFFPSENPHSDPGIDSWVPSGGGKVSVANQVVSMVAQHNLQAPE